jgi:sterol desaturase/sphingolipid hydroxylase (fatty acid hydroxylase superfamily)
MHSLHHSDPDFGATTTVRHFWLEPLIKTLTIWLAVGLLFKASPAVVGVYALASNYNFWTHSNVRVGYGRFAWLLNSPQYHRMHHSAAPEHFNSNYAALLPIFDVITGAYRPPGQDEYPATGLDTGDRPKSFLQGLLWPLRAPPPALVGGRATS